MEAASSDIPTLPAVAPPAVDFRASTTRGRRNWKIARNVWAGTKAFQREGQKRSSAYFDNVLHTFTATATEIRTGGVTGTTPETTSPATSTSRPSTSSRPETALDRGPGDDVDRGENPSDDAEAQLPDENPERDADAAVTAALAAATAAHEAPVPEPRSIIRLKSRRQNVEEWADDDAEESSSDEKESEDPGDPGISPVPPERPPVAKRQPVLSAKQQAQADSCDRLSTRPTARGRRRPPGGDDDDGAAASAPEGVDSPWRSVPPGRRLPSSGDSLNASTAESSVPSTSRHTRLRRRISLAPAAFGYLPPCVFSVVHVAMETPSHQPATACVAPSALAVVSLPRSRGGGVLLRAMSDLSAVDYAPRRPPTSPLAHAPFQRTQHWLR